MAAITVTKRIPAGIPTPVFSTTADQSACVALAVFGQQSSARIDAKILSATYAIPEDRFDATNFAKVASHPGGPLDVTQHYAEEAVGGGIRKYLLDPASRVVRLRDADTDLFGPAQSFFSAPGLIRDSDIKRGVFLDDYGSDTITARSGMPDKLNNPAALPVLGSMSSFAYHGVGAYVGGRNGLAITMSSNGFISFSRNFLNIDVQNCSDSGADLHYYLYNSRPQKFYTYQARMIGFGKYIFSAFCSDENSSYLFTASAPISGFSVQAAAPGWQMRQSWSAGASGEFSSNDYSNANTAVAEINGTWFLLMTPGTDASRDNLTLMTANLDGETGAIYGIKKVAVGVDGGWPPIKINNMLLYKNKNGNYFFVDSDSNVTTFPKNLSFPYQIRKISSNYVAYGKYKLTDGLSPSDGLAYKTDANGSYAQNGVSFWCADGKYSLVRDQSLKTLDAVGSDDNWLDRQFQAQKGMRVDYSGITMAPSQALWVVSDKDIQAACFGYVG